MLHDLVRLRSVSGGCSSRSAARKHLHPEHRNTYWWSPEHIQNSGPQPHRHDARSLYCSQTDSVLRLQTSPQPSTQGVTAHSITKRRRHVAVYAAVSRDIAVRRIAVGVIGILVTAGAFEHLARVAVVRPETGAQLDAVGDIGVDIAATVVAVRPRDCPCHDRTQRRFKCVWCRSTQARPVVCGAWQVNSQCRNSSC